MKSVTALLAIPLSVALLAAGCGGPVVERTDGALGTSGTSEPLDDSRINSAVQTKVFASEGLSSRNIEVFTMNGVVSLTGRVESEEIRQNALKVAAEAEGVTHVVDEMVVDPNWRAKAEAAEAAEEAREDAEEKKN
jgi:hyperosmotically inducible protein